MKYLLTGYFVSALVHAGVLLTSLPVLLWQNQLGKTEQTPFVQLSLAQFVPASPELVEPEPKVEQAKPESKPIETAKPVEKPKPIEKPKPKLVEKPKPKPIEKSKPEPVSKPEDLFKLTPKPLNQSVANPVSSPQHDVMPELAAKRGVQTINIKLIEASYQKKLHRLIASRKKYPRIARKVQMEGLVVVAFTIMADGEIIKLKVEQSSGYSLLDTAAVQVVESASGELPFPPEIRKSHLSFSLPVNYKLER